MLAAISDTAAAALELQNALPNGTRAEYNRVVRQAPTKLVGSPMGPAERTRLSHNRFYRAAVAFEGYAQMKIRSFLKQVEAWAHVMKHGTPRERLAATAKFGRYQLGTAASGAMAYFLLAFATGGTLGLKIALSEAKDHPIRFLRDSWLYTLMAGPYGAIIRNAQRGNRVTDWLDMALPFFLGRELTQYFAGSGQYEARGWLEKTGLLLDRITPVKRAAMNVLATAGYHRDEQRLAVAKRGYWRWRFDKYPPAQFENQREMSEQDIQFRLSMKQAYNDVLQFKDPKAHIAAAFGTGKEGKSLAQSMRARLLLTKAALGAKDEAQADAMRRELRGRIGDDAYKILEAHDQVLAEWASVMHLGGDADTAAEYRQKYGARLVELDRRQRATPKGTDERAELDSIDASIGREAAEIRKESGLTPQQRKQAMDEMLEGALPR